MIVYDGEVFAPLSDAEYQETKARILRDSGLTCDADVFRLIATVEDFKNER